MRPFPRDLTAMARNQHGLVTAEQLDAHRIVGRARSTALRSATLVTIHRGVYRFATHPVSFEQRCAAALLAVPHAVLSGPTAARFWGLRKVASEDVHVISHATISLEGVHPHKTDLLARGDWVERSGMRVLAPTRLLCDLAWHLDDAALESVFEQMLSRHMLTVSSARAQARRFRRKGRPGSRSLGRMLDGRPEWLRPVDSDLELRLWRALAGRSADFDRQVPLTLDSGTTIRFDLADRVRKFAIEVDHVTWHGGRLETQADKRRDREVGRLGWMVSRVTDEDLDQRWSETIDQLIEISDRRTERAA